MRICVTRFIHFRMKIGYARVSTSDQDPALQTDALNKAGAERLFIDKASGAERNRPELDKLLDQLRAGDEVIVWKLDRLSRSLKDLLWILDKISHKGAKFRSLTEAIDTTGAIGQVVVAVIGAFADFERSMIKERTKAGIEAARLKGRHLGRPSKLTREQQNDIIDNVLSERKTASDMARLYKIHPSNVARLVARHKMKKTS